jgi:hypothetical protein
MRLYYSPASDPMILDSLEGMNALHGQLLAFLESDGTSLRMTANTTGPAAPYDELLPVLEFVKIGTSIHVFIAPDRTLTISGGVDNLKVYARAFRFSDGEETGHHHPEYVDRKGYISPGSLSVVVEVDSTYIADLKDESRSA